MSCQSDEVRATLSQMGESEYSEKVCADWMQRRKDLGKLGRIHDPIIPTFEAHVEIQGRFIML